LSPRSGGNGIASKLSGLSVMSELPQRNLGPRKTVVIQIPSSVDSGRAISVLLKVRLTTQSDCAAPVISDETYSSDHRRRRDLIGGADGENICEHRDDSRTQSWARNWEGRGNKRPALLVSLLGRLFLRNRGLWMRRLFTGCLGWSIRPPVDFRLLSLNEPGCTGPVQSAEEEKQEGQPIRAHVN
jgi:hypothetical protein